MLYFVDSHGNTVHPDHQGEIYAKDDRGVVIAQCEDNPFEWSDWNMTGKNCTILCRAIATAFNTVALVSRLVTMQENRS